MQRNARKVGLRTERKRSTYATNAKSNAAGATAKTQETVVASAATSCVTSVTLRWIKTTFNYLP